MDFILMDIKNFLKKLQNGQLEIEAGQWELHKDITNMRRMVSELKDVKEELGKVRMNSLQQLGLIKSLQDKFEVYRTSKSIDRSVNYSVTESNNALKGPAEEEGIDEDFNKKNSHRDGSDEILEITNSKTKSELDNEESDLRIIGSRDVDDEVVDLSFDKIHNSCSEASDNFYESKQVKSPTKTFEDLPRSHYVSSSTNQDILQRYLEDSAKYLGRQMSGLTEVSFQASNSTTCENEPQIDSSPSSEYDDCSSVIPADSDIDWKDSGKKEWKEGSARDARTSPEDPAKWSDKTGPGSSRGLRQRGDQRTVSCKTCGKDFSNRYRLKKHSVLHWMSPRNSKAYKCSYCKKTCPSPEKLTQHLKKCRIITRSYNKMK